MKTNKPITMKTKHALCGLLSGLLLLAAGTAQTHAGVIIQTTTTNGTVPGTSITYTITDPGATARNVLPNGSSDNNVWTWTGGFPEFVTSGAPQTLTVNFSAPLPLNRLVLGLNSTSESTSTLTLAGGNASTSDFNLSDGLQVFTGPNGILTYNGATGVFQTNNGINGGVNQSLMIGSTSNHTITSFTLSAGASSGGVDGYTTFVGFTPTPVPEPGTALFGIACVGVSALRRRRSAAVAAKLTA